ncbi:MAG TPA: hypothetical protein VEF72_27740 [Mycobacterium sp.]|nr:hypothetical protein [Mycobacterium sp.]
MSISAPNPVGGAVRESHFRGQSNYLVAAGETDITTTETKRRRYPSGPTTTGPETRSGQTDPAQRRVVFKKWLHDDTAPVLVTAATVIGDLSLSADPAVVTG